MMFSSKVEFNSVSLEISDKDDMVLKEGVLGTRPPRSSTVVQKHP